MGGRVDKERGETGREGEASGVTEDSLVGDRVTEGEAMSEGEEGVEETGMVRGSERLEGESTWLAAV